MKRHNATHTRRRSIALAFATAGLGGCYDDGFDDAGYDTVTPVNVFRELEPNDSELDANYFGVLLPGDAFYIDGFSSDTDLDGFAFTAGAPIHVDFRLFVAAPFPDLDVCLYDPQLGEFVECFQTALDPEQGGVDVTLDGLEFHLLVESFAGSGPYSLEIVVSPLYIGREAEGGATIRATAPSELTASAASTRAKNPAAFQRYITPQPSVEPTETTVIRSIDPETGAIVERVERRVRSAKRRDQEPAQ